MAEDRVLAKEATQLMFQRIVEPWSDSFEPALVDSYVQFMSEVVLARRSPIAAKLAELGYFRAEQLRDRYDAVCKDKSIYFPYEEGDEDEEEDVVEKAIVISRVTLGADVAVSSVFLRAAHLSFSDAEIEFIGPEKNALLLGNGHAVGRRVVSYSRSALLADRLRAWLRLRKAVARSVEGLRPGEWFVIDTDSRFTQLGLLPVTDDNYYGFFPSRAYPQDDERPLASLAAGAWRVGTGWHPPERFSPFVFARDTGHTMAGDLSRGPGAFKLRAAVSLGVGGRETKRLGGEFESALLELLRKLDFQILLDYGAGELEARNVDGLVAGFSGSAIHMAARHGRRSTSADLVTIRGSLGTLAGWVRAADVFIGYDSAAAHVAASRHVRVVEVFAGAPNEVFRMRWTPFGSDWVRVIPADGPADAPSVLARIEKELIEVREERGWYE